jgi:anti-sigma regulatory factor (Ser/Thr protein kinase)
VHLVLALVGVTTGLPRTGGLGIGVHVGLGTMHGTGVPAFGPIDTAARPGGRHPVDGLHPREPGQPFDVARYRRRRARDGVGPHSAVGDDFPAGRGLGDALHLRHPADPAELRRIRGRVQEWADRNAVPEDVLVDLQLALGEAVANGVEHAYAGADPGTVDVDVEIRDDGQAPVVAVRVADHGMWRPVPMINGNRGRGLNLIERLADRVAIARTRMGTEICFEIPLSA